LKYLRGLLAQLERRNGWTIAEQAGDATRDAMQGLMCSPCFDRDAVRDEIRAAIGDPGGVLIADETGFVKKGTASAGVQRQYTGTTGKIDSCQIGVFLAYASIGRWRGLVRERSGVAEVQLSCGAVRERMRVSPRARI
jgi:SRSO17 transposase